MQSILLVAVAALGGLLLQGAPTPGNTVTVTASPAGCAAATSVQLWAVTLNAAPPSGPTEAFQLLTHLAPDGGPLRVSLTFTTGRTIEPGSCQWTFDRLFPSEYVALLAGPGGSGGSQTFHVPADTTVALPAPEVTLLGRVLREGAPRARVQVRITSFPFARPAVVVVTDENGRYVATLDRAGLHRVEGYGVGVVERELSGGTNVVDLISPGSR